MRVTIYLSVTRHAAEEDNYPEYRFLGMLRYHRPIMMQTAIITNLYVIFSTFTIVPDLKIMKSAISPSSNIDIYIKHSDKL